MCRQLSFSAISAASGSRLVRAAALLWLVLPNLAAAQDKLPSTPVGRTNTLERILPGSPLEPIPLTDSRQPVVIRIQDIFRHGSDHRYVLVYYGLEPGVFNLCDYLQRVDGTPVGDLPELPVRITSSLAPGQQAPHKLSMRLPPRLGGYRALLVAGVVLWAAGLIAAVIVWLRGRRRLKQAQAVAPQTLAEQLQPFVMAAAAGTITADDRARLERLLLAYWSKRLNVHHLRPAKAIEHLKQHPEAGPLLQQLEIWLHHPQPDQNVDVKQLLERYRAAPCETDTGRASPPAEEAAALSS